jgi:hypothetical protein
MQWPLVYNMEAEKAIVQEAATQMDEMLAGVMPDTWMGNARLAIDEYENLSEDQKERVLEHTQGIVQKEGYPSAQVASRIVEKVCEVEE